MGTVRLAMFISLLFMVLGCLEQQMNVPLDPNTSIDPAARRQADAITAIQLRGGTVELEATPDKVLPVTPPPSTPKKGPPGTPPASGSPAVPAVAITTEPTTTLKHVVKVDLHGFHNVGAALVTLEPLRKLNTLNIYNTRPTPNDLQLIGTLTELRLLDLIDCGINDVSLNQLVELKNLTELDLNQNPITDAGLARLSVLVNLRTLTLLNTKVTDQGIVYLRTMKNLEKLHLGGKDITDRTLDQLASFTNLHELYLNRCHVTDAGLARLKTALPRLEIICAKRS